ncbi:MAG: hypothetical protein U0Z53_05255 [Blastocatellia bacterium]
MKTTRDDRLNLLVRVKNGAEKCKAYARCGTAGRGCKSRASDSDVGKLPGRNTAEDFTAGKIPGLSGKYFVAVQLGFWLLAGLI